MKYDLVLSSDRDPSNWDDPNWGDEPGEERPRNDGPTPPVEDSPE